MAVDCAVVGVGATDADAEAVVGLVGAFLSTELGQPQTINAHPKTNDSERIWISRGQDKLVALDDAAT